MFNVIKATGYPLWLCDFKELFFYVAQKRKV